MHHFHLMNNHQFSLYFCEYFHLISKLFYKINFPSPSHGPFSSTVAAFSILIPNLPSAPPPHFDYSPSSIFFKKIKILPFNFEASEGVEFWERTIKSLEFIKRVYVSFIFLPPAASSSGVLTINYAAQTTPGPSRCHGRLIIDQREQQQQQEPLHTPDESTFKFASDVFYIQPSERLLFVFQNEMINLLIFLLGI